MMISTKGRYALRIMVDVAQHDGEMPVSVREIAQRQDISGKYMEQIISVLTRSGLLRSIRGAQGGYHLAKSPEQITVGMILRAISPRPSAFPWMDTPVREAASARPMPCFPRYTAPSTALLTA